MDSMIAALPQLASLSPSVVSFLNDKLSTGVDLQQAPTLLSELQIRCHQLDESLTELNHGLETRLTAYASHSNKISGLIDEIDAKLSTLRSSTDSSSPSSDGGSRGKGLEGSGQVLGEELPALAKEVARVETVRMYAETALKLDSLVGDIEDAVSSTVKGKLKKPSGKNSEEMRIHAIGAFKLTEDVLTSVMNAHPQWGRLISAVDHRVDRALAVLRPQAIADHRYLLTSLGWPPPLSTLNSSNPYPKNSTQITNPLFTMKGDLKDQYCENFLALCNLQELQRRRKSRQLEGQNREIALRQPLWAIEELVNPLTIASQKHFSKWSDKPEFIFGLVYKITRDYIDSMDEIFQPLVDEAMLLGYSCREEWTSAMVTSLSMYLAKEIFPGYVNQIDEEGAAGTRSPARISWLNLIDLMIGFDKRVRALVENSGILLSFQDDGNLQKISSLSVFCDRPDWLDLWAEMELDDILEKLKRDMEDEKNWLSEIKLSVSEDYKSPAVSAAVLQRLSSVIDRCRSIPSVSLRSRFVGLAGTPIIRKFLDSILLRCLEAEGLTALTDDDALIKVAKSINASRYCESVLKEWSEDVFFLEMVPEGSENGVFHEEIEKIEEFRQEWIEKLSAVVLRGFDTRSRDYVNNRKQWRENDEEGWTVSKSFIEGLNFLQAKMTVLDMGLNSVDFVWVWRNLASGLDRLLVNGVLMANSRFYDVGVEKFGNDLGVLFGVFGSWCLRPEGFFPKLSEGLKLLRMEEKKVRGCLAGGERGLRENGVRHLSVGEAKKIMKNRVYTS